jgi:diketogulonate reductase-like aldo/keto reductase
MITDMLENETMLNISQKHHKTIPQVAIRWLVQRNIVAIPKSVNENRIQANFDVWDFELDNEDMANIRKLNNGKKLFPEFDNVDF